MIKDFEAIRISIASPEQIRSWSYGEVTKPETINYRTLRPEKDGLFCERIFGPTRDFECYCGKYRKIRYKGVICDRCGVEVTHSRVRRERMGHIELNAPVAHIWFVKVIPSKLGLLLDLSPRNLEQVIYFAKYIVISVDEKAKEEHLERLRRSLEFAETEEEQLQIEEAIKELESLKPLALLSVHQYRALKEKWGDLFKAGMGAEAIREILVNMDLKALYNELLEEVRSGSEQRRRKALKRLRIVRSFLKSGQRPEWMILTVLPVLPPELRPLVQLDGGRFALSDLNDLYRRVINRNNRLKRLMELDAPEIIINNEKRMLQEAVDTLIDNGRHGQPLTTSRGHKLKSLADTLHGKHGRFRQNLLGKRVDYSGRAVIVVGPELKLHQCGLPKTMALELFKPFVIHKLIAKGLAHSIKGAKRIIEQRPPEVWDILEEVVKDKLVLLNRAPTLHRLSIQAFQPVLIDGSAIQLHPLVCAPYNADFDGDQMAVHVPLSKAAQEEARKLMLSVQNILLPSCQEPTVVPTLDMVLGCYYLTSVKPKAKGEGMKFSNFDEAILAYELGQVDLRALIEVRDKETGQMLKTTVGRIIFNEVLPPKLRFINETMDKKALKQLILKSIRLYGNYTTAKVADEIKRLGFHYATVSGLSLGIDDLVAPEEVYPIMRKAEEETAKLEKLYLKGLITDDERYRKIVEIWTRAKEEMTPCFEKALSALDSSLYKMASSGAKGNISQIMQIVAMRGLMSDPSGRIIPLPIRSNLRDGLSTLEYFISTHGARKGLADTALRTSDSGYLTRRLVDVAQQVIVRERDCGTEEGIWISRPPEGEFLPSFTTRIMGRMAARPVIDPRTGEVIVQRNEEITEEKAERIEKAGITAVYVRSPLCCKTKDGVCQMCYGRDLGRARLVSIGLPVGIIAAQSIGEPGTQLTMRTFHTGGVAGFDITSGLPRVEELFEARSPKNPAVISEIDGIVEVLETKEGKRIRVINTTAHPEEYQLPPGYEPVVSSDQIVEPSMVLARPSAEASPEAPALPPIVAKSGGRVEVRDRSIILWREEREEREYVVPENVPVLVRTGDKVKAGDVLTEGPLDPRELLRIMGRRVTERYLIDEIQKVYCSQGVNIHDKHIEIIIRQLFQRVYIESPGDTDLLPGELVDRSEFEEANARVLAEGGEPAIAHPVILGITRASLLSKSFLSAASFQETARVLSEAAVEGSVDRLIGLKENVIIGRLIPACDADQLAVEDYPELGR